jgi:hypothetical protein
MQGLPIQQMKNVAANKAGKVDNSPLNALKGIGEQVPPAKGENFASVFANVTGVEGKQSAEGQNVEAKIDRSVKNGNALDAVLGMKEKEQNKKSENSPMTPEQALSAESLKKIEGLLDKSTPVQAKNEQGVELKLAKTSENIEALLNKLKGTEDKAIGEEGSEEEEVLLDGMNRKNIKAEKGQSPLDFLINKGKTPNVGEVPVDSKVITKEEMLAAANPKKINLAGEDFVKNAEIAKTPVGEKLPEVFDPKQFMQKNMNQSMKAYGQKQGLLNDNIIKNTKDLAFKENTPKSTIDELKTPETKIGAQLSSIKEDFIPVMQKQEQGANLQTHTPAKVLDLSNINTSNTNEIIKRISDYVEQSQIANKDSLDLTVKHESLGQFNIQVNKVQGSQNQAMDMQITTNSAEGHEFFSKNEIGLMKNLSQAGIHLNEFKIVASGNDSAMSFSQNENRQSGQSSYNGDAPREFMSFESGDSSNGSQRRKALWEQAQQNQQRFGA